MKHLTNKELRSRYEYAVDQLSLRFTWETNEGKHLILQEMSSLHLLRCIKKIQRSNKKHLPESILTCDMMYREMNKRAKTLEDEN